MNTLLLIRIGLVCYGLIAFATGLLGVATVFDPATTTPIQDNNHRFVAAIWACLSVAFFYVAWNPSEVALFRFLMLAVFVGGLVRAYGLRYYPPSAFIVAGILIELVPTVAMTWMHARLLKAGALSGL